MSNPTSQRVAALRAMMKDRSVAFCVIPTADPHLSEYLPEHWATREWLSGFTGSAGTLIVGADFAGLWTDSRYFEQAQRQLEGSGIELMRLNVPHTPEHLQWLCEHLQPGQRVACAADMLSLAGERELRNMVEAFAAELTGDDLPAAIWVERPAPPHAPVFAHPIEYAIRTRAEKLAAVRTVMHAYGVTHHLVSALDEIAWLLNLRGNDVEFNPVFLSHFLIDENGATLFVEANKLQDASSPPSALRAPSPASGGRDLLAHLQADGVRIAPYNAIGDALENLPHGATLLLAPAQVCAAVAHAIPANVELIEAPGPITAAKARKGERELQHVREAMRRDGVALVRAALWLEQVLARGDHLTELDVDAKLRELRSQQPDFISESFSTIAGYQANAALPHYRATPESHSVLEPYGMLLIDSGGQYLGGTTDITRMWSLGTTTAEQRRDVTLVLKGVIALSRAKFPRGVSGQQLDTLARAPIWASGVDYGHGTGHGVGYFLNVHEGPQAIRPPRSASHLEPLDIGMITSIEPGIYKPGRHGVRIENLVATVAAQQTEFGEFLSFETLTLCPIDTRLLERELLDASEIDWLDTYHVQVQQQIAPLLESEHDRAWLQARCEPMGSDQTSHA